jgi:hypothetical protein
MKFISFAAVLLFLLGWTNATAQNNTWKKATTKNGQINVWSDIGKRINNKGEEVPLIRYKCFTTTRLPKAKLVATLKNAPIHKDFLSNTEESRQLKQLNPKEWLFYYYIDAPWPMPNSDCVMNMKQEDIASGRKTIFRGTAAPGAYEKQDVRRMDYNDVVYTFQDMGDGTTYVEIFSQFTPIGSAPDWLMRSWFPDGPSDILERLLKVAEK